MANLLLVDDSDAVLAFERAVLGVHHACVTASDGAQALDQLQAAVPDLVVLDLSMPVMGGDEVLRRMRADVALREVPVLVLSSEAHRAAWCREQGAQAFLPKPVDAHTLSTTVDRLLEEARGRRVGPTILGIHVGGLEFALPLREVRRVLLALPTSPLPTGPSYLNELLTIEGASWPVLDLARRLGVTNAVAWEDRPLVLCGDAGLANALAIRVDRVDDPDEVEAADFTPAEALGATSSGQWAGLVGLARSSGRTRPVVSPGTLLSPSLRRWAVGITPDAPAERT